MFSLDLDAAQASLIFLGSTVALVVVILVIVYKEATALSRTMDSLRETEEVKTNDEV